MDLLTLCIVYVSLRFNSLTGRGEYGQWYSVTYRSLRNVTSAQPLAWKGPLKAIDSKVKVWHKFDQIPSPDMVNYVVLQNNLCYNKCDDTVSFTVSNPLHVCVFKR